MNSPATVRTLQQRITEMQPPRLDDRALPTAAGLRPLLPDGALRRGSSYVVRGSQQLALALLAGPSAAGSWCGIVGDDSFGAEAAAEAGVALERCAVLPHPGAQAVGLAGSLAEVLSAVLLIAPVGVRTGDAERVAARLREHGSALIVVGDWPHPESELRVVASEWHGLSTGGGVLSTRDLSVQSRDRRGVRTHTVRFSGGSLVDPARAAVHRLVPR